MHKENVLHWHLVAKVTEKSFSVFPLPATRNYEKEKGKTMTNEEAATKYTAQYCPEQGALHIETLAEYIRRNVEAIADGRELPNYLLLGIYDTTNEAMLACDMIQQLPKVQEKRNTPIT
jgi:hypothetical protein